MGQIFKDRNVNRAVVEGLLPKRSSGTHLTNGAELKTEEWGKTGGKGNRYAEIARDVGSPCFCDP